MLNYRLMGEKLKTLCELVNEKSQNSDERLLIQDIKNIIVAI